MEVILAENAGFCFGVKKAVSLLEEEVERAEKEKTGPVYTWGPIIHNQTVVDEFGERGVRVLSSEEDLKTAEKGTVVIRAHGVAKDVYDLFAKYGMRVVDGTCPFVSRIHDTVREQSEQGRKIVIIGDAAHPEVMGIVGWCTGGKAAVLKEKEDALTFQMSDKAPICVVSQTTFNHNKFKELVEILLKKEYDIIVFNTICSATQKRQTEAKEIASRVDAMLVIGDAKSSNTQKLFEICKAQCNTYHIQAASDIDLSWFSDICSLGITAGASTPQKIITEVQNKCQN